jgi:hypothetical protein
MFQFLQINDYLLNQNHFIKSFDSFVKIFLDSIEMRRK